jgi:hypothetical protein
MSAPENIKPGKIESYSVPSEKRDIKPRPDEIDALNARLPEGDRAENTTDNPLSVAAWRKRAETAEAALAAAVQDAERYRWLRDESNAHDDLPSVCEHRNGEPYLPLFRGELDAAIDAARAGKAS